MFGRDYAKCFDVSSNPRIRTRTELVHFPSLLPDWVSWSGVWAAKSKAAITCKLKIRPARRRRDRHISQNGLNSQKCSDSVDSDLTVWNIPSLSTNHSHPFNLRLEWDSILVLLTEVSERVSVLSVQIKSVQCYLLIRIESLNINNWNYSTLKVDSEDKT